MAERALRERIDADLGTLFEFQADPEASAMAAFPSRDLPAFLEHEAKIKAERSTIKRTIVAGGGVVGSIGTWEVVPRCCLSRRCWLACRGARCRSRCC